MNVAPENGRVAPASSRVDTIQPTARRGGTGLATRLLLAQALLLIGGAGTAWLVASAVGPGIFHSHLVEAGVGHTAAETLHVERAFRDALLIALGVALLASVLIALVVTAWFSRRVQRSTAAVAQSAHRITLGQYGARVPDVGLGGEFDQLAGTINALAQRLGDVETTRRRLLADLAHEMRTPLATIEAHLEAVEDGVRDLDSDTLAVLHASTGRLHRLAEDITTVSRAEEGRLELRRTRVVPRDLAETAAAALKEAYDSKGVTLTLEGAARDAVNADPDRLAQVLGNLLENALRHTGTGGLVTLAVRQGGRGWIDIVVTDNGEGIAEEHLPHLFERFYRGDPARTTTGTGSGIGLTISRAIVEAHAGTLTANSGGPGRGAAFTVTLPAAA
jgi:signal transduction histidine kinase